VKGEVEDTILLSSSSTSPVQERGGARGSIGLHDTFIRCAGGELLGCHAVVLAASSPLLRRVLLEAVEATTNSEDPALVHLPDFSAKEVDNLLNLLYSGACTHTEDLMLLLNILGADESNMNSIKPEIKSFDDVKIEAKEFYEDEDSYFFDNGDMNEFDNSDQSSEEEWEIKTKESKKKKQRSKQKRDGKVKTVELKPEETKEKEKRGYRNRGYRGIDKMGRPRMHDLDSDEESEASDFEDSKPEEVKKEFKLKKDNKLIDMTVNFDVLINEINKDPKLTISQMEINGLQIFRYSCEHCVETFQNIVKFSKHMHEVHVDNIDTFNSKYRHYVCFGCSRRFLTIVGRTRHMQRAHTEDFNASKSKENYGKPKTLYACPYCKEQMEHKKGGRSDTLIPLVCSREASAEHIMKHEFGEEGFRCNACPEKFSIIHKLRFHIIRVHLTDNVVCTECGKVFPDGRKYQSHMRMAHKPKESTPTKEQPESFFCELCAKLFTKKSHLYHHMRYTHGDPNKLLSCKTCGKKSHTKKIHSSHEALHLPPTIPCDQCGKMCHTKELLRRHIISHHTAHVDMPCKCDQCGKGFSTSILLEYHMNVHLGLKPFKCRYCNNFYQNPSNCMSHEKKGHPDLYKKLTKSLGGVRVKDRDMGKVHVTEEQLGVHM